MSPPLGFIPWNKKNGRNKGRRIYLKLYREALGIPINHTGRHHSEEWKKDMSLKMSNRKLSDEHKRRIGIKTSERCKGKNFYELHGLIGSMEKRAKIISNSWPKKMKGHFPASTLEKKRLNMLGEKNPGYGIRGEHHHSWLGGKKFEPYTSKFNKHFKKEIKLRDAMQCMKCGMREEDHKKLFKGQGLQCHHINFDKSLSCKENCCLLCTRCHCETNYNRPQWTAFFQSILSERYGYQYQGGQIVLELEV